MFSRSKTIFTLSLSLSLLAILLVSVYIFHDDIQLVLAATGDVTAVRIIGDTCTAGVSCNGWVAEIDMTGLSTGGTYNMGLGTNNDPSTAKIVFTVTSPGYDTSGNTTTITRTIYGTKELRKPYPDQATMDEVSAGGTLTVRVALSDFIYSGDTAITANISSGFYTGSNAATNIVVTNNSTLAYPKSVGRWAWPGYERVTGDFLLESVIFNRFARNGKPLAAVKYTCSDAHSNTVTQIVNDMTVSTRTGDANKVLVYAATIPVATLTQGDVITCNFTAYPWVGDSTALLNSDLVANGGDGFAQPDERLGPLYEVNDKGGTYGQSFAVVDDTNGLDTNATTYVGNVQATIESDYNSNNTHSYKSVGRATAAIKAYNLATYGAGRNNPGGGTILLNSGNHTYPGTAPAASGVMDTWLIVQPMSTVTKAQAIINAASNTSMNTQKVKISGITVNSNATGQFVGTKTSDSFWLHANSLTVAGAAPAYSWLANYATQNTVVTFNGGFVNFSTEKSPWAIFRGNTVSTQMFVTFYTILGNSGKIQFRFEPTGNVYGHQISDNSIAAFNSVYAVTAEIAGGWALATNISIGIGVIQNIVEKITATTPALQIAADGTTATTNNVLFWYNSVAGGTSGARFNLGYNDVGTSGYLHKNWSQIGNNITAWNNKDDTFGTQNANRVGSWPVGHNVGTVGNVRKSQAFRGEFDGLYVVDTGTQGYVNDQSGAGADGGGTGNGDYHLLSNSSALNLIPTGQSVLPYDLDGNPRHNNGSGAAGAYEWDVIAPTVDTFAIPSTSDSLSVSITTPLTASDAVGVTGYKLTETSTAPAYDASGWSSSAPTTYTFSSEGSHTLYAWAKDAVGNVSSSRSSSTTITLPVSSTPTPTPNTGSVPIWFLQQMNIPSTAVSGSPATDTPPTPSVYGLKEGNLISSSSSPDIYIINDHGYKRLFLNPIIFSMYGHLGSYQNVKTIQSTTTNAFQTSTLFRNCETNDQKVYSLQVTGEDTGILHHISISGDQAITQDPNFFKKVFCINSNEFNWYTQNNKTFGSSYTELEEVGK